MSDYLTRLVQRSLGLVPMVQPRVSPYFTQNNELGGPVISRLDEPGSDSIEIDAQQEVTESFKPHRASHETQDIADAGPGNDISPGAVIERVSNHKDGGDAGSTNHLVESSGGVGGFLKRMFKPKMTAVVQLKQAQSDGSSPILPTVTTHSAEVRDAASHQHERSAGQSQVTTASLAYAKQAEHPRPAARPLNRPAATGQRQEELALSEEAVSELPDMQTSNSEVAPQSFTARKWVPDSIEQIGRGTGDHHRAQQPDSDPASEKNRQTSRSSVVDDSTKSASISSVHLEEVSREESSFQDETDRQDSPLSETHAEVEPMGLQESGSRAISPRARAAEISEPQFDYNNRPTGKESSKIEIAIDRIEVRAAIPTPPVRPRRANTRPTLSLDEYLNRSRRQGR